MARTLKTEYSNPDGWHISCRLARQARPAGRMVGILAAEEAADGTQESVEEWESLQAWEAELAEWEASTEWDGPDGYTSQCGCYCRRCLLHDDCGGCIPGHIG